MKSEKTYLVLTLFLLGIFMGAIDSGIISPAREIIQHGFGVARNVGMWMITLYTLIYAVAMPIVSKMADRYGHKKVYIFGIAVFGLGSFLCGLSNFFGGFSFFLLARAIQAVGAGGIIPIANNVIGQSFPEEKRGTALGLVGAIYGVATIFGPTMGSGILSITGNQHWGWLFFINVPISLLILALSGAIKNTKTDLQKPLDLTGAIVLAGVIGSLMYALTNIDLFHLGASLKDTKVYPFLITFAVLIPLLIVTEQRAQDPVMKLQYFTNRQMLTTLILAFIVGVGMMGMVFVPQFAENVLKIKAGTGGYLVTLLAVFSGIAAPLSGKLIDKKGARLVLTLGFLFTLAGTLFLGYIATVNQNFIMITAGLAFMGFGVGFTMGAPLNYLVLQQAPQNEGATALATMSLVRSIGVTVSPSIMIGFIVNAAKDLQPKMMDLFQQVMGVPMGMMMGNDKKAAKLFSSLQNADVTNVVDKLKGILHQVLPAGIQNMVLNQVEQMRGMIENTFQTVLNTGYSHMFTAAAIIAGIGFLTTLLLRKKGDARQITE